MMPRWPLFGKGGDEGVSGASDHSVGYLGKILSSTLRAVSPK